MSKQFLVLFFFSFFPREINAGENASVIKSPPNPSCRAAAKLCAFAK